MRACVCVWQVKQELAREVHAFLKSDSRGATGDGRDEKKQEERDADIRQRLVGRQGEVPSSLAQGYAAVAPHPVRRPIVQQGRWSARSRRDWKTYDPFESLARQQTHWGNAAAADVLQGSPAVARPESFVASPPVAGPPGVGVAARHPAHRQRGGGKCAEQGYWAQHPEECLRQVYGSGLQGTKFARLGAVPPKASSSSALNQERRHIASEVSSGLLSGAIQVRQGSALAARLERARNRIDGSLAAAAAANKNKKNNRARGQEGGGASGRSKAAQRKRRLRHWLLEYYPHMPARRAERPRAPPPAPRPPSSAAAAVRRPLAPSTTLGGALGKLASSGLGLIANIVQGMGVAGGESGGGGARGRGGRAAFEAGEKAARSFYDGARDARSVCGECVSESVCHLSIDLSI